MLIFRRNILMESTVNYKKVFADMKSKWASSVVARSEIGKFSGGLLNGRTQANRDSLGEGCEMIKIGRRVGYPVDSLISWMEQRMS
jgi:hypothetical protein